MSKPKKESYGLLAPEDIRWLLQSEPEVMNVVKSFIVGQTNTDVFDVTGPANDLDIAQAVEKGLAIPFPTVQLRMKMFKDRATGNEGVEVRCSDAALEELHKWRLMAHLRKARTGQLHRA